MFRMLLAGLKHMMGFKHDLLLLLTCKTNVIFKLEYVMLSNPDVKNSFQLVKFIRR